MIYRPYKTILWLGIGLFVWSLTYHSPARADQVTISVRVNVIADAVAAGIPMTKENSTCRDLGGGLEHCWLSKVRDYEYECVSPYTWRSIHVKGEPFNEITLYEEYCYE